MSNNNKENFVKNITALIKLDTDTFRGLPQKVKDAKKQVDSLLAAVKEKKESFLLIRQAEEEKQKEQESVPQEDIQVNPAEEQVVSEQPIQADSPVEEAPTANPVVDNVLEEPIPETTEEAVKEEVVTKASPEPEIEIAEVVSDTEKPVITDSQPVVSVPEKVEPEVKPVVAPVKEAVAAKEKAATDNKKESKKPEVQPQKAEDKKTSAPQVRDINKYRAQNVVEPRIFIPPQPEKKKPVRSNSGPYGAQGQQGAQNGPRPDNRPNPQSSFRQQPAAGTTFVPHQNVKDRKQPGNKKYDQKANYDEKKSGSKRSLMRDVMMEGELSDGEVARRFKLRKGNKGSADQKSAAITSAIIECDPVPIKVLSEKIGRTTAEIIRKLIANGSFKTANDSIDFSTAELICMDMDIALELRVGQTNEEKFDELAKEEEVDPSLLVKRAPVVTIMGHVDHGKTTLLDYIRKANVAKGEAGGITQHIGAYTIRLRGEKITFIDTPGHEAFTTMRARGAMVTDIAIIVVAADDSIMPQTIEAINHAKAANVPIIVAINKIDRSGANIEKVKNDLLKYDLICEEYGGDTICVPVSAKIGTGVDVLLDQILMLAELYELKANPKAKAKGTILEARLDHNVGAVATVLVQNGTLKIGDFVVAGSVVGKVKSMYDDKKALLKSAGPSIPVSVLGFDGVPSAGDQILAVDEKFAKAIAEERRVKERDERINKSSSLEDIIKQMNEGKLKDLNLIIKCDVQGSVEALSQELLKLCNDEVKVNVVHNGVGAVNESDVTLASTCGALIIAFNVRPDQNARSIASKYSIEIRCYSIIYEAISDIQAALKGMLAPKFRENVLGRAEVRNTFKITGVGTIAGCYVTSGKLDRSAQVRLLRNDIIVYTGEIGSLKRVKDDVKEVLSGFECGLNIEKFNDIKVGDAIECFIMEKCD